MPRHLPHLSGRQSQTSAARFQGLLVSKVPGLPSHTHSGSDPFLGTGAQGRDQGQVWPAGSPGLSFLLCKTDLASPWGLWECRRASEPGGSGQAPSGWGSPASSSHLAGSGLGVGNSNQSWAQFSFHYCQVRGSDPVPAFRGSQSKAGQFCFFP